MEGSKWQVRRKKLVCMPTQRYDAPSGKVGKIFVGILSVELDRVSAMKWNTDRVIVFQSVILLHTQGVNISAQIRKCIFFRLDFWNRWAFDELVKDTYNSAMVYLGKFCGNQTEEQHHKRSQTLSLKENCAKPYDSFAADKRGEFYNQKN